MKKSNYNVTKIAGNIKKRRLSMDLSRDELAKRAKVNYNTIIKIESGANKNPTIQTLIGISKVLDTNVEDLIV
ncbi:MAG TPA: helix-turn-helix transcriptional regulator [Patescibacteria group bacterium]|nr:helix-turn-helix transcriptional regulator [Patescibacteria group bacterium]